MAHVNVSWQEMGEMMHQDAHDRTTHRLQPALSLTEDGGISCPPPATEGNGQLLVETTPPTKLPIFFASTAARKPGVKMLVFTPEGGSEVVSHSCSKPFPKPFLPLEIPELCRAPCVWGAGDCTNVSRWKTLLSAVQG